ncbi:MAG: hypothetical protein ACI37S_03650 [Candidatus Gastranaerophilaceae bacterium]
MMDNLLYIIITHAICIISFITAIILIAMQFIKKKPLNRNGIIISLATLVGMYLYIPMQLTCLGFTYSNPAILKKAITLSINPYEKRLCYNYLAGIYSNDMFKQGIKDGNKAIMYMEKALKGQYKKYPEETKTLAYWYSIKGDYNKTLELNKKIGETKSLSLKNIYILNNEYEKAINSSKEHSQSAADTFLNAALHEQVGDFNTASELRTKAQSLYSEQLVKYQKSYEKIRYQEQVEKYKSISSYKNWLAEEKKSFKFAN